jgi:ribonuclease HI
MIKISIDLHGVASIKTSYSSNHQNKENIVRTTLNFFKAFYLFNMTFYKKSLWIPGHSGIPGNDKADLESKQMTLTAQNA